MKKLLLLIIVTITLGEVYAQNFNKSAEHLIELSKDKSKHVYVDFLKEFEYVQEIGLGESVATYETYKTGQKTDKSGNIRLKKHPFFQTVQYGKHRDLDIIDDIRFTFDGKKYQEIKDMLTALFGTPDNVSYGHLGQSNYYVPHKYTITLSSNHSFLNISALDFSSNYSKYDDFSKVGMIYYESSPIYRFSDKTQLMHDFIYTYNDNSGYKGYALKIDLSGKDWLFMEKIEFLLDGGEVLSLDLTPDRDVSNFFGVVSCKEKSTEVISAEFMDKILNSETVKVKISGKTSYLTLTLRPVHKYQILTAKECFSKSLKQ